MQKVKRDKHLRMERVRLKKWHTNGLILTPLHRKVSSPWSSSIKR
jgi:hypothetical protein